MGAKEKKNTFEARIARLEAIVTALEADDVPLEQSMQFYREGMECARMCRQRLDEARHELRVWQDGEESDAPSCLAAGIRGGEDAYDER